MKSAVDALIEAGLLLAEAVDGLRAAEGLAHTMRRRHAELEAKKAPPDLLDEARFDYRDALAAVKRARAAVDSAAGPVAAASRRIHTMRFAPRLMECTR